MSIQDFPFFMFKPPTACSLRVPSEQIGNKKKRVKLSSNSLIFSYLTLRFRMGLNQRPPD